MTTVRKKLVEVPLETSCSSSIVEIGDVFVSICQDPNKTKTKARVVQRSTGHECWIREPRRIVEIRRDDGRIKRAIGVGVFTGRRSAQGVAFPRLGAKRFELGPRSWPARYFLIKKQDWENGVVQSFSEAFGIAIK